VTAIIAGIVFKKYGLITMTTLKYFHLMIVVKEPDSNQKNQHTFEHTGFRIIIQFGFIS